MCLCVFYTVHASSGTGAGTCTLHSCTEVYSIAVLFWVPNDPCDERDKKTVSAVVGMGFSRPPVLKSAISARSARWNQYKKPFVSKILEAALLREHSFDNSEQIISIFFTAFVEVGIVARD